MGDYDSTDVFCQMYQKCDKGRMNLSHTRYSNTSLLDSSIIQKTVWYMDWNPLYWQISQSLHVVWCCTLSLLAVTLAQPLRCSSLLTLIGVLFGGCAIVHWMVEGRNNRINLYHIRMFLTLWCLHGLTDISIIVLLVVLIYSRMSCLITLVPVMLPYCLVVIYSLSWFHSKWQWHFFYRESHLSASC